SLPQSRKRDSSLIRWSLCFTDISLSKGILIRWSLCICFSKITALTKKEVVTLCDNLLLSLLTVYQSSS
ncbi:MAG: hypothetical protein ACI4HL_04510, partial [Ruminococcus sp.]